MTTGGMLDDVKTQELHPLNFPFRFYFMSNSSEEDIAEKISEDDLQATGSFSTLEQFWCYHKNLVRPSDLPDQYDCCMFKGGIKPISDSEDNIGGGKWSVKLRKGLTNKLWEELLMAVIAGAYGIDEDICGVAVSVRADEDRISVWNDHRDMEVTLKLRESILKVLKLPHHCVIEYKRHGNQRPRPESDLVYNIRELLAYKEHCKEPPLYVWESYEALNDLRFGRDPPAQRERKPTTPKPKEEDADETGSKEEGGGEEKEKANNESVGNTAKAKLDDISTEDSKTVSDAPAEVSADGSVEEDADSKVSGSVESAEEEAS